MVAGTDCRPPLEQHLASPQRTLHHQAPKTPDPAVPLYRFLSHALALAQVAQHRPYRDPEETCISHSLDLELSFVRDNELRQFCMDVVARDDGHGGAGHGKGLEVVLERLGNGQERVVFLPGLVGIRPAVEKVVGQMLLVHLVGQF